MSLLILLGISSFHFLTKTDVQTSVNLAREIRATYLAESIAAQIEARTNRHPWEVRFWLQAAQEGGSEAEPGLTPMVAFNKSSSHVNLSGDVLPAGGYNFSGIVKDVSPVRKEYRIYVEILIDDERFTFAWDKKYQESLLGGMNKDASIVDKRIEEIVDTTLPTDQLMEKVKESAAAPPPGSIQEQFQTLLKRLDEDSEKYEGAQSLAPAPSGQPVPPLPPQLGP